MSFGPNRFQTLATWLRDKFVGLSKPRFLRSPALVVGIFAVVTVLGLTVVVHPAKAMDIPGFIGLLIAWLLHYVVAFEGWLLIKMVGILIWVAQYNGFINAKPVETGWFIVRDIVNMFFILMLLVIAFGTILDIDEYNYKKTLPKLLISAVLVNFSRTFVGIFIDISQVIMLTFVNGFSEAATGNFANAFRINKLLSAEAKVDSGGNDSALAMKMVAGWILAAILVGFSLIIVIYMTVVLVMRIVWLWLLIIVSPAAYFVRGTPFKASSYYDKWWDKLKGHLISGPFIAFFLWLALLTVSQDTLTQGGFKAGSADTGETNGVEMGMFSGDDLQAYIIAMAMLFGGIEMAGQVAGLKLGQVTGAPGKGWKMGKSVIQGTQKAWEGTNKLLDKTPIGRGRDALKGGVLSMAAGMGSMSAAKSLAEHRDAMQKKGGDNKWIEKLTPEERSRFLQSSKLPNALKSPERINMEREALRQHMTDLTRGKGVPLNPPKGENESDDAYKKRSDEYGTMVRNDYQASRDRLKEIALSSNDRSVDDFVKATNKARPDLIVDESLREKDPKKYGEQIKELREGGRALSTKQMSEMDASAFVPQSIMFANAQTLKSAMLTSLNQEQIGKLDKMGITEDMTKEQIERVQNRLKANNSQYLSEDDKTALAKKQREDLALSNETVRTAGEFADPGKRKEKIDTERQKMFDAEQAVMGADDQGKMDAANKVRNEAEKNLNRYLKIDDAFENKDATLQSLANLSRGKGMDKDTVDLFASSGPAGVTAMAAAMKSGIGADAGAMAGQKELTEGVAKALSGSDIAKLPGDLAKVLRESIAKDGDAAKVFKAGGSVKEAFGKYGYDEASGSIKDADGFASQFKDKWSQLVGHVDSGSMAKNGGVNDLSMAVVSGVDPDLLKSMASGDSKDTARAVVGSAYAVRDADAGALVQAYEKKMTSGGMDTAGAQQAAQAYAGRLKAAQNSADKLIESVSGADSPLAAAVAAGIEKGRKKLWDEAKADYAADVAKTKQIKRLGRGK